MTRQDARDVGAGLLVIAAVLALLHGMCGCGSAAQGSLSMPTTPQHVSITIDASDGGTAYVGGDVWLDARGGAASTSTDQQGQDIDADVDVPIDVHASAAGTP